MLSDIRKNIKWSGYYILAPENGSADNALRAPFEEVWQYGSDLGQTGADPMWQQDGVAPQAAVKGLVITTQKYGRAFIPKNQDIDKKGFVKSHSIGNYGWIFSLPATGINSNGYVTPR